MRITSHNSKRDLQKILRNVNIRIAKEIYPEAKIWWDKPYNELVFEDKNGEEFLSITIRIN